MILLSEIFQTLAHGELNGLHIGNSQLNTVDESNMPKLLSHVNLGLVELSKRFILRTGERTIHQIAGRELYPLRSEYAELVDQCGDNDYFIEQTDETPFEDDVVKILHVYNSLEVELPLNDRTQPTLHDTLGTTWRIMTPELDVIQMTPADAVENMSVVYQALYPHIVIDSGFDAEKTYVAIPRTHLMPLLLFVASRVVSGMNTSVAEGEQNPMNTWMYQYELACRKIEQYGLTIQTNDAQQRFTNNGFV